MPQLKGKTKKAKNGETDLSHLQEKMLLNPYIWC